MKMYCNVVDSGSVYIAMNAFTINANHINFTTGNLLLEIDNYATYESILTNLDKKKIVRIPKNINPLMPGDLIINNGREEIDIEKSQALTQLANVVNERVGSISNFYFFEFSILDNILRSKGYSITEANREEQYLLILETADEFLIETLQSFLEAQDKISEMNDVFGSYKTAVTEIEESTTVDEVIQAKNSFMSKFN